MERAEPSATSENLRQVLRLTLEPLADPEKARWARAYMRNQFDYLGIATAEFRAAIRPVFRGLPELNATALLAIANDLWQMHEREYQYCAIGLLLHREGALRSKDLPAILRLVQKKPWWDTVDSFAKLVGMIVRRDKAKGQPIMDRAVQSSNFWVRRIAMIHQLGWRGDTDTARLFFYAEQLAPEKEFFIRKAVGWALRDYARHDSAAVRAFLKKAKAKLSPLSYREASKHL